MTKQNRSRLRYFVGAIVLTIVLGSAIVLVWLNQGRGHSEEGHQAYLLGDCQKALPWFEKVSRYPLWAGAFVADAASKMGECLAFTEAERIGETDRHRDTIEAYTAFRASYQKSPMAMLALDRAGQAYLAWGDDLQDKGEYELAMQTFQQMAEYDPNFRQEAQDRVVDNYHVWGEALRHAGDFPDAVTVYEELAKVDVPNESALETQVAEQILDTYLEWGDSLRSENDYSRAVAVYAEFTSRDDMPAFVIVRTSLIDTYLEWGNSLRSENAFSEAIAVFDELDEIDGAPAGVAISSRSQAYLEWGRALLQDSLHEEAAQAFRLALAQEHELLAPLTLTSSPQNLPWPYPHGVVRIFLFRDVARLGPGFDYEAPPEIAEMPFFKKFALVGMSPDGEWYEVMANERIDEAVVDEETRLRDLGWETEVPTMSAWVPAEEVELVLALNDFVPLDYLLVQSLSNNSEVAEQAFHGLKSAYTAWSESAATVGDYDTAANTLGAMAEWTLDEVEKENYWRQIAQVNLQSAEALASDSAYEASLEHVLTALDYDLRGDLTIPAHTLLTANLLTLGEQAAADLEWERAVDYLLRVLRHERDDFTSGLAHIVQDGTPLYASADSNSEIAELVNEGNQLPIIAKQNNGDLEWVLLFAPSIPEARAWAMTEQVTSTVSLADVPTYDANALPPFRSHIALVNLALAQQDWASALRADGDYAQAIIRYQAILEDPELNSVITGTAELAARTMTDWGDLWMDDNQRVEAAQQYANSIELAPESEAAAEASIALETLMDDVELNVAGGDGCSEIEILETFEPTGFGLRANRTFPQALFQCGVEQIDTRDYNDARASFRRIIDDYSDSRYLAQANYQMLVIDWLKLIDVYNAGLYDGARRVCREAGSFVQASVSTLATPYAIFANFPYWWGDLPNEWQGSRWEDTNVVVCIEDLEEIKLDTCRYVVADDNNTIYSRTRVRTYLDVRIVNPHTRLTVAQGRIYGGQPSFCDDWALFTKGDTTGFRYGDEPELEELVSWLERYIPRP